MSLFKSCRLFVWLLLSFMFIALCFSVPYDLIIKYSGDIILTEKELQEYMGRNGILYSSVQNVEAIDEDKDSKIKKYTVGYKLFNLFNILSLKVDVVDDSQVYVGGDAVGIVLDTRGVILVGSNPIVTKEGLKDTLKTSELKIGDVILKLNSIEVNSMEDLTTAVTVRLTNQPIDVEYKRNGQIKTTTITPMFDELTKEYKLGLWVKDNVVGVGTMTFVKQNYEFGALGHAITDGESQEPIEITGGQLYEADIVGVKKGEPGVPGELMGLFVQGSNKIGSIDRNTVYGIYGSISEDSGFVEGKALISIGSRSQANPGKAQILASVDGKTIEMFDIEIIKTNFQSTATEKSMVIKVVDEDLLNKTGGIVQGMSGSPIIQNGKLIGAVTHVFVSDPTKGFGLYLDWMMV